MDIKQLIALAKDLGLEHHIVEDPTQECWVEGDEDGVGSFMDRAGQYGSGYYDNGDGCYTYFFQIY